VRVGLPIEGSLEHRHVLDPRGRVVVSVYSSGAIGRLVPEDVIGLLRHDRDRGVTTAEGGGSAVATVNAADRGERVAVR
jgi:hypothetical protein